MIKKNLTNEHEDALAEELGLCDGWTDMIIESNFYQLFKELDEHFIYTPLQFNNMVEDVIWEKNNEQTEH